MPYSLVLDLVPLAPLPASHLSGRHLHALFLDLVRAYVPDLATKLHSQTRDKAFTLSPLQTDLARQQRPGTLQWHHSRAIPAGTPCWWRITLLDEGLFAPLAPLWLGMDDKASWRLGGSPMQVSRVFGTSQPEQPWAGFASYAQLYQQASDRTRQLPLRLCTPTNFRISQYDSCLPTRDRVFKSLLKRWNAYSQIPFSPELIDSIYPSELTLRSAVATDNRSKFIGCVGEITFAILGKVSTTTIQQINALALFSLYAGIGRKTPMGMGQTYFPSDSADSKPARVSSAKPMLKAEVFNQT